MFRKLSIRIFFFLWLLALILPATPVLAASEKEILQDTAPKPGELLGLPAGFEAILSEPAVTLFRKNYPNGSPDYVQVVLLNQGAQVDLLHGQPDQPRTGKGVFGGNDARFNLESLMGFWSQAERANERAFCIVNGSFFYMPETPTRLPFSLKVDGVILTDGYGEEQYLDQTLMLELWADRADIRPLNAANLNQSTAPDILGGLSAEANKRAKFAVGRTFVGLQDRDQDGNYETLFVLSTQTHTQSGAAQVLKDFGAQKVMMLDGGGSAQLACHGKEYIATGRLIPQAIAVFSADPAGLEAKLIDAPELLSAGLDESINQVWLLENSGEIPWTPGDYRFVVEAGPNWDEQHFSPQEIVNPGQQLQVTWSLPPFQEAGTHSLSLNWYVTGAGRQSQVTTHHQELVVFSSNLEAQSSGAIFGAESGVLQVEGDEDGSTSASTNLTGQAVSSALPEKISLKDLMVVPAIILPLGIILFWFFTWLKVFTS